MKIALYLGSFNPFHNGHLMVIRTALKQFGMDKVIIVPAMQNPWKEDKALDFDKRVEIICRTLDKAFLRPRVPLFNYVSVEDIETKLIPPYYSYATLHALKNKYCNDKVFVLCGEDTMKEIPNWMNGEQIIIDYDFLIVDRQRDDISSTLVREYIKNLDKDIYRYAIKKCVSPNVIDLLEKYYKSPDSD